MSQPPVYRSQVLDHLGLVAGMFDELGIGDVIDQATHQNPELRDLTVGEAVKAMVLNGLGFINQTLYLVPRFFQNKPTYRLIAPRVAPEQRNDDALGRALETLYAYGVTELYSLIATTAAQRLGLAPTFAHLDSTSFHVDGRSNSAEEPEEHVIHITRGYSRDQRPDLNQVMLALIVEHQAGIPVLMKPLSGNSSDAQDCGQIIADHVAQVQITYGTTFLVADSALYSAENLQKLAETRTKWITRVPRDLARSTDGLGPSRSADDGPADGGVSLSGRALDLRRGGATLGAHPLRATPAAGAAHCGQTAAEAKYAGSQSLQATVPHSLCL